MAARVTNGCTEAVASRLHSHWVEERPACIAGLSTLKRAGSAVAFLRLARRTEVVARPALGTGRRTGVGHVVSAATEQRGAKGHHDDDGFHSLEG